MFQPKNAIATSGIFSLTNLLQENSAVLKNIRSRVSQL
jgi:hypothetical protein